MVETPDGLLAAWFGGTREGQPDVGIWTARYDGARWSAPIQVADGVQPDGRRFPCYNPVLFQPSRGPLLLFYRVGPEPAHWWSMVKTSDDGGRTWSAAERLPDGRHGPIRSKPVELGDGTLLAGSSTEHAGWVAYVERRGPMTVDRGPQAGWERSAPLNDTANFGAIQPTLLVHWPERIQALARGTRGVVTQSWSLDSGRTWSPMQPTLIPNPNAAIDAERLADGRFVLVYNPLRAGRHRLDVVTSRDGTSWRHAYTLEDEDGEYSYPAVIQTRDGLLHITYTWRRERIRHVVLDPR